MNKPGNVWCMKRLAGSQLLHEQQGSGQPRVAQLWR